MALIEALGQGSTRFAMGSLFFVLTLLILYVSVHRTPHIPKGLCEPPTPPGARPLLGHAHIWNGNATKNPSEGQLVKWARKYGEIYQIWMGTERWVVLSSPEAIKVRLSWSIPPSRFDLAAGSLRQEWYLDREQTSSACCDGCSLWWLPHAFHGMRCIL